MRSRRFPVSRKGARGDQFALAEELLVDPSDGLVIESVVARNRRDARVFALPGKIKPKPVGLAGTQGESRDLLDMDPPAVRTFYAPRGVTPEETVRAQRKILDTSLRKAVVGEEALLSAMKACVRFAFSARQVERNLVRKIVDLGIEDFKLRQLIAEDKFDNILLRHIGLLSLA